MLSILRKKFFINIQDVYFAEPNDLIEVQNNVDVLIYEQSAIREENSKECHTLFLDLSKDENQLFSEMKKETKRKINTAHNKESLLTVIIDKPSMENIRNFKRFYNVFALKKGIKKCDMKRLLALRKQNALCISLITDMKGKTLCYHAYILNKHRVRILYSSSHFRLSNDKKHRNLIGRANRYLHWNDIKYFKKCGYLTYDFGGLSTDENNQELQNINIFKKSFGGSEVVEYNTYKAISLKGKIALRVLKKG